MWRKEGREGSSTLENRAQLTLLSTCLPQQQPWQTGIDLKNLGTWIETKVHSGHALLEITLGEKAGNFEFSGPYFSSTSCTLLAEHGCVVSFPFLSGVGTAAGLALPIF